LEELMIIERTERIHDYLGTVSSLIAELPGAEIDDIIQIIKRAYEEERHVLVCGNGGSAATASHLAEDLQKGIGCLADKRFRVMALTDSQPLITAWANDSEYANIFVEQIRTWAKPGDLLIAFSGSGNSPNVIRAIETANEIGMTTIGFTGMGGGKLAKLASTSLVAKSDNMQQIEDVHMILTHLIYTCLYKEIAK
jgi:D-sedoheptulose 7-phosphate isomerase